jgi:hypothetical protein
MKPNGCIVSLYAKSPLIIYVQFPFEALSSFSILISNLRSSKSTFLKSSSELPDKNWGAQLLIYASVNDWNSKLDNSLVPSNFGNLRVSFQWLGPCVLDNGDSNKFEADIQLEGNLWANS